jgi:hypothetical protein
MKWFFSILFFSFLSNQDLSEIRKIYPNASNSISAAKEFNAKFTEITDDSNKILTAYKGASIIVLSKFEKKISDKKNGVKQGVKLIEIAIGAEPSNIEIRLIRLSIQENLPKIAGYNKNKSEDKAFLLSHFNLQPNALKEYVKRYILHSKSFSQQEKQTVI